jgi:hypothetical protein
MRLRPIGILPVPLVYPSAIIEMLSHRRIL